MRLMKCCQENFAVLQQHLVEKLWDSTKYRYFAFTAAIADNHAGCPKLLHF
jgi:hypothetical protein